MSHPSWRSEFIFAERFDRYDMLPLDYDSIRSLQHEEEPRGTNCRYVEVGEREDRTECAAMTVRAFVW